MDKQLLLYTGQQYSHICFHTNLQDMYTGNYLHHLYSSHHEDMGYWHIHLYLSKTLEG
jgi:hypothetical protein